MAQVAVVGSVNLDVVVSSHTRPRPGETVTGDDYGEHPGGKGANQAMSAARVAASALVAAVGDDDAGRAMVEALRRAGVDTRHVCHAHGPSGRAVIIVTPDGENSIVVLPLANATLDPVAVRAALDDLDPVAVLTQLETPMPVTVACADWATRHRRRFVLNPSPIADVSADVVAAADPLVVNELEARALLAELDPDPDPDKSAAETLAGLAARLATRCRSAVVTAGPAGAWASEAGTPPQRVAAPGVVAVDTTGAGDAFTGTLAAHLAGGAGLLTAVEAAVHVATALVAIPRSER